MNVPTIVDVAPLLFMGLALGMDVFSISLGLGMQRISVRRVVWIGFVFGVFHMLMPFLGILFGHVLSREFHLIADLIGGLLLVGLGVHMIFSTLREKEPLPSPVGIGVWVLAFSISLDSFTVGITLGMVRMQTIGMLIYFGVISTILAWVGMVLGKKVNEFLGTYSQLLGGSILCGFGIYIVFT